MTRTTTSLALGALAVAVAIGVATVCFGFTAGASAQIAIGMTVILGGGCAAAWLLRSPSATVAAMASIPAGAGATVILAAIAPPHVWLLSSGLLMIIGGGCMAWLDWTTLRGSGELPPRTARMYALVRTLGVVAGAAALAFVVATGIGPWEPGP